MSEVTVSQTIHSPLQATWATFAEDFGGIYKYNPRVKHSPLTSSITSGLGATRRCEFHDNSTLNEKIVGWEKEKELRVQLIDAAMPLKDIEATIRFQAIDDRSSKVAFTMSYTPKFGPLGWVMDRVMIRMMMRKIIKEMLDGLDRHLATGEIINLPGKQSGPVTGAV
ncbi:MAG: SRPBCC family protein [Acidiferrobacterales bacterium]